MFEIISDKTLVTDPHPPILGKLPKDLTADVVTVSHNHMDHNFIKGVGGDPEIIDKVGDFETGDFQIKSIKTFHDGENGKKRGENIVFVISIDDLKICHLGDLGHILNNEQIKEIGKIDILMIPVGGFFTIDADIAVKVIKQLKPMVVLPMHYKVKGLIPLPIAGVDKFIKALSWKVKEVSGLEINSKNIKSFNHTAILFK